MDNWKEEREELHIEILRTLLLLIKKRGELMEARMETRKFWIVLIEGNKVPAMGFHAHYTLHDAEEEAARLIRKVGGSAVIMESIIKGEIKCPLPPISWSGL